MALTLTELQDKVEADIKNYTTHIIDLVVKGEIEPSQAAYDIAVVITAAVNEDENFADLLTLPVSE